MSSKTSNKAITVNQPDDVRNVVLIGNAGSGKTSLFEQLLKARVEGYRGEKTNPERLAQLYLASFTAGDSHVNLLDAPGHPDFVGELRAGIRAADAAVFVVSAADGIDGAAEALWNECVEADLPRIIALTKIDAPHVDFDQVIEEIKEVLGDGVLPTHVPIINEPGVVDGNVSLLTLNEHLYTTGEDVSTPAVGKYDQLIEDHRGPLIEGIIQETEDDELMDRYLGGEEIDVSYLRKSLMKATATGNLYPVVPVVAANGVGIEQLISLIKSGCPTPSSRPVPAVVSPDGEPWDPAPCAADAPLIAQVIRTTTDPFSGKLSMVRVFSGTLKSDTSYRIIGGASLFGGSDNRDHRDDERVGHLQIAIGSELVNKSQAIAGEIVMIPKLSAAETSDSITSTEQPGILKPWALPDPLLPLAIKAETRNDEDKLAGALQRLATEDSTVRLDRGSGEQLVLWTTGQAHADLLLNRLKDRYGVNVTQEEVKIPLRETFIGKCETLGRHVKQSGGHGQYAVCNVRFEPLERGAGFEFVDEVVGGAVPRQFIPSVEKGVRNQMEKGVLAGYPMVDVRVTLYDGKAHSVDSSDMAFQMAGAAALKEAASKAGMVALLEPIDEVTIMVAEEYLGAVMTDISGRRGQLMGTDSVNRKAIIKALVPQSELSRYAIDLRGLSQGSGTFTRSFHGYELLPSNLVDKYLKKN